MAIRKASRRAAFDRARSVNPILFDRIMSKVVMGLPQECWATTLSKDACGYSVLKVGTKNIKSHRLVHSLFRPNVEAPVVRHTCDNPACVNPLHLIAGTPKDNARDRMVRGRSGNLKGENNGRAKLSKEQVLMIRSSAEDGAALGRKFGVSKVMVNRIRRGLAWSHI